MNAEIIAVGTELLLGNVTNTNARDISEMLSEIGINVYYHTVVGDNPGRLRDAVALARGRADIIVTTGGLGPTYDDLTKQTLAECFGKTLVMDEEIAEGLRAYFRGRYPDDAFPENNLQQAMIPEGATVLENDCGTAPGCAFEVDGTHVLMLPGPPRECLAMFRGCAMPYLRALSNSMLASHNIHIFGMGESAVEEKLRDMMMSMTNPTLAPYAKIGEVVLRVTAKADSEAMCEALMQPVLEKTQEILGDAIYGIDVVNLERMVIDLLQEAGLTISIAESCTGGLLSKRLTDVPGASDVYTSSVVTYSNESKERLLGIPMAVINEHGAVSEEVAKAMANGAKERLGTDIGIGITGIAGPSGGTPEKPVGTVYVGIATPEGMHCKKLTLRPDREIVRFMATNHALDLVRRYIQRLPM